MGGEVIEDDADALGLWEVDIDELAHAKGEVVSGATISDLDPAPRAVGIRDEDEEIDGAVAAILVVEALEPSGCPAGIGWRASPMSWVGLSSKQTTGRFGSGCSA